MRLSSFVNKIGLGIVAVLVIGISLVILFWMAGLKTEQEGAAPRTAATVEQPLSPRAVVSQQPSVKPSQPLVGQREEQTQTPSRKPINPVRNLFFLVVVVVVIVILIGLVASGVIFSRFGEIPEESMRLVKQWFFIIQVDRGFQAYIENQRTGRARYVGPGIHLVLWPFEKVIGVPEAEFQLPLFRQDVDFLDVERAVDDEGVRGMVDGWVLSVLSIQIFNPSLMVGKLAKSIFEWPEIVTRWAKGYITKACRQVTFPNLQDIIPVVKRDLDEYLRERGIRVVEYQIQESDIADPNVKAAYAHRAMLAIRGDAEEKYRKQVELSPELLVLSQAAQSGLLGTLIMDALMRRGLSVRGEAKVVRPEDSRTEERMEEE